MTARSTCSSAAPWGYADPDHPPPLFISPHTANWRGRVAEWQIERDALLLTGLTAWKSDDAEAGW
jgi:hypothetical protein